MPGRTSPGTSFGFNIADFADLLLGIALPGEITVKLDFDPSGEHRLWTDGKSRVYLTITDKKQLKPCLESGTFNLYEIFP